MQNDHQLALFAVSAKSDGHAQAAVPDIGQFQRDLVQIEHRPSQPLAAGPFLARHLGQHAANPDQSGIDIALDHGRIGRRRVALGCGARGHFAHGLNFDQRGHQVARDDRHPGSAVRTFDEEKTACSKSVCAAPD